MSKSGRTSPNLLARFGLSLAVVVLGAAAAGTIKAWRTLSRSSAAFARLVPEALPAPETSLPIPSRPDTSSSPPPAASTASPPAPPPSSPGASRTSPTPSRADTSAETDAGSVPDTAAPGKKTEENTGNHTAAPRTNNTHAPRDETGDAPTDDFLPPLPDETDGWPPLP